MSKNDDTEFRQFYQEILKRTKDMEEYGAKQAIQEDSFVVQDGKGKEYIYVVKLDGYLHGVVLEKIDKTKYVAALQRETKGGANGKSVANIKRRIGNARSEMGRNRAGNGRNLAPNGDSGHGGLGNGSSGSDKTGYDAREGSADRAVPTITKSDGKISHQDRDSESVSNRSLLANALEGVVQNDLERQKLAEYRENISQLDAQEEKLAQLNAQIKELSFAPGKRDTAKIRQLRDEATKTANRIGIYDTRLLRLEASAPLQKVLEREKKKAYQRAEKKGKEALADYKAKVEAQQKETAEKWRESRKKAVEGRQKTAMRHRMWLRS